MTNPLKELRFLRFFRSGKFWFGIQDSCDATNFGVEPKDELCYSCCGCLADDVELYCSICYESYDDHKKEYLENNDIEDENNFRLIEESNFIYYNFTSDNIHNIQDVLNKIEEEIDVSKVEYTIEDKQGEAVSYDISGELPENSELLARWCLGKQILYYLNKYNECNFSCEC